MELEKTPTKGVAKENPNGEFHTHANLTQALTTITADHFRSTHTSTTESPAAMPAFMAEAVHMAFSNIAAAANGNPYFAPHWKAAAAYCQAVANILTQAEEAAIQAAKEAPAPVKPTEDPPTIKSIT